METEKMLKIGIVIAILVLVFVVFSKLGLFGKSATQKTAEQLANDATKNPIFKPKKKPTEPIKGKKITALAFSGKELSEIVRTFHSNLGRGILKQKPDEQAFRKTLSRIKTKRQLEQVVNMYKIVYKKDFLDDLHIMLEGYLFKLAGYDYDLYNYTMTYLNNLPAQ